MARKKRTPAKKAAEPVTMRVVRLGAKFKMIVGDDEKIADTKFAVVDRVAVLERAGHQVDVIWEDGITPP